MAKIRFPRPEFSITPVTSVICLQGIFYIFWRPYYNGTTQLSHMLAPDRLIYRYFRHLVFLCFLCPVVLRAGDPDRGLGATPLSSPGRRLFNDLSPVPRGESAGGPSRWWTRLYGAAFYDTRWDGWFLQSYLQQGYDLLPEKRLSAYGIAWMTADTRSSGSGPAPAIISDNILLLGAGIRFRPAPYFWIDAQQGVAFDLVERNGATATRGDFRLVATGGAGVYPEFLVHGDFRSPMTLMAECFLSSGYYSRYDNVITYVQGRFGVRVAEVSRAFMDVYLRGDAAFDSEREFYNNLFEIGPGLRFTPDPDWGLFVLVEYRHGIYADYTAAMQQRRELFYPSTYNAVRFFLVLDREF